MCFDLMNMAQEYHLKYKPRISARASKDMILLFAKYGNHFFEGPFQFRRNDYPFRTDADVKRFYSSQGIDFKQLVMNCRNFSLTVPIFENQIGSTISTIGNPRVSRFDFATGKEDLVLEEPGTHTIYGYWAAFEGASQSRDLAVSESSFVHFHMAIVQGIASIEGYIKHISEFWNNAHPTDQLIDSRENKVSLDEKFDRWIPKLSGGNKFDKSIINWDHFKILKNIRDDNAVHPKTSGFTISYSDLAEQINMFRTGIAGILIQLHLLFHEKIPAVIIRARYTPDVYVVEEEH